MGKKRIKRQVKSDIEFTLKDLEGDTVEFSLVPLKQWVAAEVFHNVVLVVINALGGAFKEKDEDQKVTQFIQTASTVLTFEKVQFLLQKMMAGALVDGDEVDVDDLDIFEDNPQWIYQVLFHGVKGNWPNVFLKLGDKGKGLFSRVEQKTQEMMNLDTEE